MKTDMEFAMNRNGMLRFFAMGILAGMVMTGCGTVQNTAEPTAEALTEAPSAIETTETAEVSTADTAERAEGSSMKETLEGLDGVIHVEVVEPMEGATFFSEKYMVTFEQPLDWSDPSKGTFPQRVEVGICDDAEINVLETDGYSLVDELFPEITMGFDDEPEMTHLITKSGNYVHVEHRFFGKSQPEDMNYSDTKYWEYHTPENAANDYHKIYTTLAPLFGDRWVSVGTSRGGLMTNVYAKYFPEDMQVYIAYVAPCSDGIDNRNMYRFIYEEAGEGIFVCTSFSLLCSHFVCFRHLCRDHAPETGGRGYRRPCGGV